MSLRLPTLRAAAAVVSAILVFSAATARAEVLAKVNGVDITDQDVAVAETDLAPTIPPQLQGAQREQYVVTYLIDLQLVAAKAATEKLDQSPGYAKQMAYFREKVLMESLLGRTAKDAATDAAIKQAYDEAAKAQKPEVEIRARHILTATKQDAEAALKRIKAGEDFAKVADEVSKDPNAHGGDLGWFTKDQMVPAFAAAAFKLQPGQVSDPVQTQFGWHIIKVEGRREKPFPPLEQVKADVERYLGQKAQGELIMQLRQSAKIERFDQPPGKVAPAPQASGAPKK